MTIDDPLDVLLSSRRGKKRGLQTSSVDARTRAFASQLETTLAELDTAKYEAVEIVFPAFSPAGVGRRLQGPPRIFKLEPGAPPAEERFEEDVVRRVVRYEADDVERLRTYVAEGTQEDVERLLVEDFDVPDTDAPRAARKLVSSLERHGVGGDDGEA